MQTLDNILKFILKGFVLFYRTFFSVIFRQFGGKCRFHPDCSSYGLKALNVHGGVKGFWLTAKRFIKCGPFHPGGYDPVPSKFVPSKLVPKKTMSEKPTHDKKEKV